MFLLYAVIVAVGLCSIIISANTSKRILEIAMSCVACICLCAMLLLIGVKTSDKSEKEIVEGNFNIENIDSVEQAEDELELAKIKLEIEKTRAEALKIQAESEALSNITVSQTISKELLIKMFIEKWDGKLPENITISEFIVDYLEETE